MKQCTSCKEFKPLTQFGNKSWTNKDGSVTSTKRSHCRSCVNKSNLDRFHNNPKTKEAHKTASYRHRIKSYGLSIEEYENKLKDQNHKCDSCGKEEKLVIDHDHITGKVRGLICHSCNIALGNVKDSVNILKRLIKYLRKHSE